MTTCTQVCKVPISLETTGRATVENFNDFSANGVLRVMHSHRHSRSIIRRMNFLRPSRSAQSTRSGQLMRSGQSTRPALVMLLAFLAAIGLISCSTPDQPDTPSAPTPRAESSVSGEGGTGAPSGSGAPSGNKDRSPATTTPPATGGPTDAPASSPSKATGKQDRNDSHTLVLATEASSNALAVVDPANRRDPLVAEITVGAAPWDVAVHPATGRAFVSTAEGVAVVDLEQRRRTALIPYSHHDESVSFGEYRDGGTGIAVGPEGRYVYVAVVPADGNAVLEKIDLATKRVVDSVEVGLRPFDILISDDGSEIYTIDHDSFSVHVVDTAAMSARRIEVAPFGTEGGLGSWEKPHYGVLAEDGNLLLPYQGLALAVVNPDSGKVTTKDLDANSHQHGAALSQDGSLLAVIGTGSFGNATGGPNLTLRNTTTGEAEIIPLDRPHETAAFWTDPATGRQKVLLSGGYTRPEFWNDITVVDVQNHQMHRIPVPHRPQSIVTVR